MKTFPDFGKELRGPFMVDERRFDCAELYHGRNATPENPAAHCADRLRLPDVMRGTCGADVPAVEDAGPHRATHPLGGRCPCAGPGAAEEFASQSASPRPSPEETCRAPYRTAAVRLWRDPSQGQEAL